MSSASSEGSNNLLSSILSHIDDRLGDEEITLSQCLRKLFSTKQRPSRFVANLLPRAEPVVIQDTAQIILDHVSKISADLPCLLSIKVVAATIFFLQLVLESVGRIDDSQILQMTVALIQSMQQSICAVSQSKDVWDEVDTVPQLDQHAPTLAGFFFGVMLRSINPYVPSIPMLLSPLWKSLCEVATSATPVPYDYTNASLLALLAYMKGVERFCLQSAASFVDNLHPPPNLPQHLLHAKMLGFLVLRAATLTAVCCDSNSEDEEEQESLLSEFFGALVCLRGISTTLDICSASEIPAQILQSHKSVDKKIDQCVLKVFTMKQISNKATVNAFRAIHISQKPCFESRCARLGKLNLLQSLLQITAVHSLSSEASLLIVEQGIFSILPTCSCELLVGDKCRIDSSILHVVVRTAIHLDRMKGTHVRLMLMRWLSRAVHPISKIVVVAIVHNYVVALGSISNRAGSPRSAIYSTSKRPEESMVALLSQLFFDFRTITSHRENISSVLHRLLSTADCQTLTQRILLNILLVFIKELKSKSSKKCKTTGSGKSMTLQDWNCIFDVVMRLDFASNKALEREVQTFIDDVGSRDDSTKSNKIFNLKGRSPCEVAVLIAGAQHQAPIKLLGWFFTQSQRRKDSSPLARSGTVLTCSVLRFLGRSLKHSPDPAIIGPVAKILSWTLVQARHLFSVQKVDYGMALVLAMGEILGRVGPSTSPSTSAEALTQIASCFYSLFHLALWPVSAITMNSLTEFASTIPKAHQGILKTCLPLDMQVFFTCRLQGKVYRYKAAHGENEFELVQSACTQQVMKLIRSFPTKSTPFAVSTAYNIAPGSFLLPMPTVEGSGRSALVVFPPGDESLSDIKHMLQTDKVTGDQVRQLHCVRLSNVGGGCRLFSQKYE